MTNREKATVIEAFNFLSNAASLATGNEKFFDTLKQQRAALGAWMNSVLNPPSPTPEEEVEND